ncbi:MAG: hypothetical protein A2Z99_06250 [Treponema sp. GWB1_62_6]|nr:MAG: hypothetical protein A2Y36_00490 [Treponema sp. GWA1_62_8]OHE64510.1 MAG: hypothetical protein A2001_03100 [Treponema sp. GWC1_61_84]OHE64641.1 MAG: hypothetical protein A2Z99_06250 [Treponema sp. GWB1_62_6]OHE71654.1 MAG: hypothetical protein A2413_02085 [Treponema sp. RIFOXYC1_FULL_61_9]
MWKSRTIALHKIDFKLLTVNQSECIALVRIHMQIKGVFGINAYAYLFQNSPSGTGNGDTDMISIF